MISSDRLTAILDVALAKNAPNTISRTPPHSDSVDCYVIRFELEDESFIVDGRDGEWVQVRRWSKSDDAYVPSEDVSIFALLGAQPRIAHFLREYDIEWVSWEKFSFDQRFRVDYLRVWANQRWARFNRARIGRRKLVTIERARALNAVWEMQLQNKRSPSSISIASHIYGQDSALNPGFMEAHRRLREVLDGLVDTKDLRKNGDLQYLLTGQGAQTLERIEEENARHRDAMSLQRRIVWLTLVLAVVAVLQAKVVDLPPILKIENWPWSEVTKSDRR